ncbi:hypothetical protein, partial [Escherichia coli]|uniref:hypothetical protein n=4 Tax=Enterobacteriaceae TaxID=543 RepID=UPI001C43B36D
TNLSFPASSFLASNSGQRAADSNFLARHKHDFLHDFAREPECNSRSQNNLGVGGTLFARVEGVWESRPRTFLDYLIQLLVDPIHVTWGDSEPERTFKVFHATFLAEHNEFSILVSGYGMDGE